LKISPCNSQKHCQAAQANPQDKNFAKETEWQRTQTDAK